MNSKKIKDIPDGREDIYIGDENGAHIKINQEMLYKWGIKYSDVIASQEEIGRTLMVFGLMLVNKTKKEKSKEDLTEVIGREFAEELEQAARHGNCSVEELMRNEDVDQLKAWFELGYITAKRGYLK